MPARPVPEKGAPSRHDALLGGRYRLLSLIGSGGTADVFRGVDQLLGREVAVKVFREGAETVTADRFCDEARTLARLSHRALVTVYDAGRHAQGAFMVTELIRGVTLRTRLDAGPLSPVQVTRLGAEISSALDHVHAHGIIHHDVKPSNVLLHEDGSPHLADFGLSRTVYDQSHGAPDSLVGTLAYMAPEQLLGRGASTASDIYALGVTLLEALTGCRAHQGEPVEVATADLLHPPRIPEGLPGHLGRVLTAMTHQDPQARPDAAAVHIRLRDAMAAPAPRGRGERGPHGHGHAPLAGGVPCRGPGRRTLTAARTGRPEGAGPPSVCCSHGPRGGEYGQRLRTPDGWHSGKRRGGSGFLPRSSAARIEGNRGGGPPADAVASRVLGVHGVHDSAPGPGAVHRPGTSDARPCRLALPSAGR